MVALRKHIETEERGSDALGDLRFRTLLSRDDWALLPDAVRRRFSKRLKGGSMAVYVGEVKEVRISLMGKVLATVLRLVGAPLPIFKDVNVPTVVTVTEDVKTGGQIWSRLYGNRKGFPQVIHSAKRFAGPTGLVEHVGYGIAMALRVTASAQGLVFSSAGYSIGVGSFRIPLPRLLMPGDLTVKHLETVDDRFLFEMTLVHPLFGELVHQAAEYRDGV
jgi:hypothetical protein